MRPRGVLVGLRGCNRIRASGVVKWHGSSSDISRLRTNGIDKGLVDRDDITKTVSVTNKSRSW